MAKALGRDYRKGASLMEFMQRYRTDAEAEAWFVRRRWPHGICCPFCGSVNVQTGCSHAMPYRCREKACGRRRFSTKSRSVMEGSKLGYQVWLAAMFVVTTNLKSVSSMKLHRDLGVTQKTAWFLARRLRDALSQGGPMFAAPVEVDEICVGGKRGNVQTSRRKGLVGRTKALTTKSAPSI